MSTRTMTPPHSPQAMAELQRAFALAQSARNALVEQITRTAPAQAALFALPDWLQTRPLARIDAIVPKPLEGPEAHHGAVMAMKDLHRRSDDEQSQKVRRYPGVLRFHPPAEYPASFPDAIGHLSDTLAEFKTHLHRLTEGASNVQDQRFELLHQIAPQLFTMHLYRTPVWLGAPVRRIRFGWVAKRIVAKIQKEVVLEKLANALTNPGQAVADMAAWQDHVAREYRAVEALPAYARLRIDRPGGLRPTAFIQFTDGSRRQVPANLPLLFAQSEPVTIAPLPSWQAKTLPQARGECVIPRLHLYQLL